MDNPFIEKTKEMITSVGLPIRGSYRPGEVCKILGISLRSFWRMTEKYERDPRTAQPIHPATLDSFRTLGQRRVRINELADFISRNDVYEQANGMLRSNFSRPGRSVDGE